MLEYTIMQKINVLQSVIKVQGKIFHNDGRRRIDIKKPIRDIFEPLEGGQTTIVYTMELCLSKKKSSLFRIKTSAVSWLKEQAGT